MINISGADIELRFDMRAMVAIEREFGGIDEGMNALKDKSRVCGAAMKFIAILGNSALVHAGCEPVLTEAWIEGNFNPSQVQVAIMEISEAVAAGFKRTVQDKQDNAPVDEILVELQKKMAKGAQ